MQCMVTILKKKKMGNQFLVNLDCTFEQIDERFVNYEHLFKVVKEVFFETGTG